LILFSRKITAAKVSISFVGDKVFHILLQRSASVIERTLFIIEKILSTGADVPVAD